MIVILFAFTFVIWSGVFIDSLNLLMIIANILIVSHLVRNKLKHLEVPLYLFGILLSIATYYYFDTNYLYFIKKGYITLALFTIVMFIGVFPSDSKIYKNMLKYRKVMSIIGFILITPHVVYFCFREVNIYGIIAYFFLTPPFITSFNLIKENIEYKEWVYVQKASYFAYIAIFLHVILIANTEDKYCYIVLLTLYINNKIIKFIKEKK